MKPTYLEFCGINSFSETAKIDFESLLQFGIFGIFGDTGSGKSTILDCIGFALYGEIARSRSGSAADIINYKKDRANVVFEFEIVFEGRRRAFRVEREIRRKNAAQNVKVYEKTDGEYLALADGVRESNALLKRIIGLEQRDFEKCIALPQGEFAQFVKTQRSDRLKLVSRLFDLERYGEGLSRKVRDRYYAAREEGNVIRTKLEPYAELTRSSVDEKKKEYIRLAAERKKKNDEISALRAEEKRLSALFQRTQEAEALKKKRALLEGRRADIERLEGELQRLERASAVAALERERKQAEKSYETAIRELETARRKKAEAEEAERLASLWDESKTDGEIAALIGQRARAEHGAETERRRAELTEKLERTRREYGAEAQHFRDFDYEAERAQTEGKIASLGGGDFLDFAERHGKALLLRGEYAVFKGELEELSRKYPDTREDILPLIEKYAALSEGETTTFSEIRKAYEAREEARKRAQEALRMLEKRNGEFNTHREKLKRLSEDGTSLRRELEALGAQKEEIPLDEIDRRLKEKQTERKINADRRDRARAAAADAGALFAAASERCAGAKNALGLISNRVEEALKGVSATAEEAIALVETYGDAADAKARLDEFGKEWALVEARLKEYDGLTAVAQEELSALRDALSVAEREGKELEGKVVLAENAHLRAVADYDAKRTIEKEYESVKKREDVFERLKKLVDGNKFMEFVAEEYLQTVALNASGRLVSLTDGRYFLRYDSGFFVGDNFNGGQLRAVHTLSGGETFLVSLSLALALSAEICRRSLRPVEFFFLDEGFGTLDGKLVDTVMDSLEKLKGEHFSIGIISHVEELKHRIDRKLTVKKATEQRGSQILAE